MLPVILDQRVILTRTLRGTSFRCWCKENDVHQGHSGILTNEMRTDFPTYRWRGSCYFWELRVFLFLSCTGLTLHYLDTLNVYYVACTRWKGISLFIPFVPLRWEWFTKFKNLIQMLFDFVQLNRVLFAWVIKMSCWLVHAYHHNDNNNRLEVIVRELRYIIISFIY